MKAKETYEDRLKWSRCTRMCLSKLTKLSGKT